MALVKDYGAKVLTYPNFQVDFKIPDNCNYVQTLVSKTYNITVQLNPGCNKPSAVYMACSLQLNAIDDCLDVDFVQILNGITTTKPKIKIVNT
ncbi:hypothetical protein [Flavobacterium caeni]|uniref:Uncharacterized protein n=1 Tax=Flavobacterium caeni TaxID=490189 RepID=A0A1G5CBF3_9FLAO|nr:hypothetical protein [Flavobacterium caeni]SCX99773.1 hypothetical protein SAMN02927903_00488 [Flavobacterium caeni]